MTPATRVPSVIGVNVPGWTLFQAHRNAELRKTVGKIGGAVQRVDIPAVFAFQPLARALFAIDAVLGKSLAEPAADELFDRAVGHCHQVHVALVFGLDARGEELAQPRASLAGDGRSLGNPHKI